MGELRDIKIGDLELNSQVSEEVENTNGGVATYTTTVTGPITVTLITLACSPSKPGGNTEYCY